MNTKGGFFKIAAGFTAVVFFSGLLTPLPAPAYAQIPGAIPQLSPTAKIEIPEEIGRIEEVVPSPETGKLIVHIQNAHGNYQAQKNIQAILKHLNQSQNFQFLFLEGGAGKLRPELMRLFPSDPNLNAEITDALAKEAELTGAELFMIEDQYQKEHLFPVQAFGIENAPAYRKNRVSFQNVLRAKEKTEAFLMHVDLQIERLTSPYMNPVLKNYLRQLEAYETKRMDLTSWLGFLKKLANERLQIDFGDPFYQKDWPMMVRLFRLQKIEPQLDPSLIEKERKEFVDKLKTLEMDGSLIEEVKTLVSFPLEKSSFASMFPYQEAIQTLGRLLEALPKDFSFRPFGHLKLYLQFLILQSELKIDLLRGEMENLEKKITDQIAKNEVEKELLVLFEDYRLLKKLFALELTRAEYEKLQGRKSELVPTQVINRFQTINRDNRVRQLHFHHMNDVDQLFELALSFYEGAHERDGLMADNLLRTLQDLKQEKAVLVTGGFHSEGMKEYFEKKGFNYFLISPRITEPSDNKAYRLAMLDENAASATSQVENVVKEYSPDTLKTLGGEGYAEYAGRLIRAQLMKFGPTLFDKTDTQLLRDQWKIVPKKPVVTIRAEARSEGTQPKPQQPVEIQKPTARPSFLRRNLPTLSAVGSALVLGLVIGINLSERQAPPDLVKEKGKPVVELVEKKEAPPVGKVAPPVKKEIEEEKIPAPAPKEIFKEAKETPKEIKKPVEKARPPIVGYEYSAEETKEIWKDKTPLTLAKLSSKEFVDLVMAKKLTYEQIRYMMQTDPDVGKLYIWINAVPRERVQHVTLTDPQNAKYALVQKETDSFLRGVGLLKPKDKDLPNSKDWYGRFFMPFHLMGGEWVSTQEFIQRFETAGNKVIDSYKKRKVTSDRSEEGRLRFFEYRQHAIANIFSQHEWTRLEEEWEKARGAKGLGKISFRTFIADTLDVTLDQLKRDLGNEHYDYSIEIQDDEAAFLALTERYIKDPKKYREKRNRERKPSEGSWTDREYSLWKNLANPRGSRWNIRSLKDVVAGNLTYRRNIDILNAKADIQSLVRKHFPRILGNYPVLVDFQDTLTVPFQYQEPGTLPQFDARSLWAERRSGDNVYLKKIKSVNPLEKGRSNKMSLMEYAAGLERTGDPKLAQTLGPRLNMDPGADTFASIVEDAILSYVLTHPGMWKTPIPNQVSDFFDNDKIDLLIQTHQKVWRLGIIQQLYRPEYGADLINLIDEHLLTDEATKETPEGFIKNRVASPLEKQMANVKLETAATLFPLLEDYRKSMATFAKHPSDAEISKLRALRNALWKELEASRLPFKEVERLRINDYPAYLKYEKSHRSNFNAYSKIDEELTQWEIVTRIAQQRAGNLYFATTTQAFQQVYLATTLAEIADAHLVDIVDPEKVGQYLQLKDAIRTPLLDRFYGIPIHLTDAELAGRFTPMAIDAYRRDISPKMFNAVLAMGMDPEFQKDVALPLFNKMTGQNRTKFEPGSKNIAISGFDTGFLNWAALIKSKKDVKKRMDFFDDDSKFNKAVELASGFQSLFMGTRPFTRKDLLTIPDERNDKRFNFLTAEVEDWFLNQEEQPEIRFEDWYEKRLKVLRLLEDRKKDRPEVRSTEDMDKALQELGQTVRDAGAQTALNPEERIDAFQNSVGEDLEKAKKQIAEIKANPLRIGELGGVYATLVKAISDKRKNLEKELGKGLTQDPIAGLYNEAARSIANGLREIKGILDGIKPVREGEVIVSTPSKSPAYEIVPSFLRRNLPYIALGVAGLVLALILVVSLAMNFFRSGPEKAPEPTKDELLLLHTRNKEIEDELNKLKDLVKGITVVPPPDKDKEKIEPVVDKVKKVEPKELDKVEPPKKTAPAKGYLYTEAEIKEIWKGKTPLVLEDVNWKNIHKIEPGLEAEQIRYMIEMSPLKEQLRAQGPRQIRIRHKKFKDLNPAEQKEFKRVEKAIERFSRENSLDKRGNVFTTVDWYYFFFRRLLNVMDAHGSSGSSSISDISYYLKDLSARGVHADIARWKGKEIRQYRQRMIESLLNPEEWREHEKVSAKTLRFLIPFALERMQLGEIQQRKFNNHPWATAMNWEIGAERDLFEFFEKEGLGKGAADRIFVEMAKELDSALPVLEKKDREKKVEDIFIPTRPTKMPYGEWLTKLTNDELRALEGRLFGGRIKLLDRVWDKSDEELKNIMGDELFDVYKNGHKYHSEIMKSKEPYPGWWNKIQALERKSNMAVSKLWLSSEENKTHLEEGMAVARERYKRSKAARLEAGGYPTWLKGMTYSEFRHEDSRFLWLSGIVREQAWNESAAKVGLENLYDKTGKISNAWWEARQKLIARYYAELGYEQDRVHFEKEERTRSKAAAASAKPRKVNIDFANGWNAMNRHQPAIYAGREAYGREWTYARIHREMYSSRFSLRMEAGMPWPWFASPRWLAFHVMERPGIKQRALDAALKMRLSTFPPSQHIFLPSRAALDSRIPAILPSMFQTPQEPSETLSTELIFFMMANPDLWADPSTSDELQYLDQVFDSQKLGELTDNFRKVWDSGLIQKLYEPEYGNWLINTFLEGFLDGSLKGMIDHNGQIRSDQNEFMDRLAQELRKNYKGFPLDYQVQLQVPLLRYEVGKKLYDEGRLTEQEMGYLRTDLFVHSSQLVKDLYVTNTLAEIGAAYREGVKDFSGIRRFIETKLATRPLLQRIIKRDPRLTEPDDAGRLSATVRDVHRRNIDPKLLFFSLALISRDGFQKEALDVFNAYSGQTLKRFALESDDVAISSFHTGFLMWYLTKSKGDRERYLEFAGDKTKHQLFPEDHPAYKVFGKDQTPLDIIIKLGSLSMEVVGGAPFTKADLPKMPESEDDEKFSHVMPLVDDYFEARREVGANFEEWARIRWTTLQLLLERRQKMEGARPEVRSTDEVADALNALGQTIGVQTPLTAEEKIKAFQQLVGGDLERAKQQIEEIKANSLRRGELGGIYTALEKTISEKREKLKQDLAKELNQDPIAGLYKAAEAFIIRELKQIDNALKGFKPIAEGQVIVSTPGKSPTRTLSQFFMWRYLPYLALGVAGVVVVLILVVSLTMNFFRSESEKGPGQTDTERLLLPPSRDKELEDKLKDLKDKMIPVVPPPDDLKDKDKKITELESSKKPIEEKKVEKLWGDTIPPDLRKMSYEEWFKLNESLEKDPQKATKLKDVIKRAGKGEPTRSFKFTHTRLNDLTEDEMEEYKILEPSLKNFVKALPFSPGADNVMTPLDWYDQFFKRIFMAPGFRDKSAKEFIDALTRELRYTYVIFNANIDHYRDAGISSEQILKLTNGRSALLYLPYRGLTLEAFFPKEAREPMDTLFREVTVGKKLRAPIPFLDFLGAAWQAVQKKRSEWSQATDQYLHDNYHIFYRDLTHEIEFLMPKGTGKNAETDEEFVRRVKGGWDMLSHPESRFEGGSPAKMLFLNRDYRELFRRSRKYYENEIERIFPIGMELFPTRKRNYAYPVDPMAVMRYNILTKPKLELPPQMQMPQGGGPIEEGLSTLAYYLALTRYELAYDTAIVRWDTDARLRDLRSLIMQADRAQALDKREKMLERMSITWLADYFFHNNLSREWTWANPKGRDLRGDVFSQANMTKNVEDFFGLWDSEVVQEHYGRELGVIVELIDQQFRGFKPGQHTRKISVRIGEEGLLEDAESRRSVEWLAQQLRKPTKSDPKSTPLDNLPPEFQTPLKIALEYYERQKAVLEWVKKEPAPHKGTPVRTKEDLIRIYETHVNEAGAILFETMLKVGREFFVPTTMNLVNDAYRLNIRERPRIIERVRRMVLFHEPLERYHARKLRPFQNPEDSGIITGAADESILSGFSEVRMLAKIELAQTKETREEAVKIHNWVTGKKITEIDVKDYIQDSILMAVAGLTLDNANLKQWEEILTHPEPFKYEGKVEALQKYIGKTKRQIIVDVAGQIRELELGKAPFTEAALGQLKKGDDILTYLFPELEDLSQSENTFERWLEIRIEAIRLLRERRAAMIRPEVRAIEPGEYITWEEVPGTPIFRRRRPDGDLVVFYAGKGRSRGSIKKWPSFSSLEALKAEYPDYTGDNIPFWNVPPLADGSIRIPHRAYESRIGTIKPEDLLQAVAYVQEEGGIIVPIETQSGERNFLEKLASVLESTSRHYERIFRKRTRTRTFRVVAQYDHKTWIQGRKGMSDIWVYHGRGEIYALEGGEDKVASMKEKMVDRDMSPVPYRSHQFNLSEVKGLRIGNIYEAKIHVTGFSPGLRPEKVTLRIEQNSFRMPAWDLTWVDSDDYVQEVEEVPLKTNEKQTFVFGEHRFFIRLIPDVQGKTAFLEVEWPTEFAVRPIPRPEVRTGMGMGFGIHLHLSQEQELRQEMHLSQEQRQTLAMSLKFLQQLELEEPVPPQATKGLEALQIADKILKERGAVGIVIGSMAGSLWNLRVKEGNLEKHKDLDVVVLNRDFKLKEKFEGGVDWWLPEEQRINIFFRGSVSPSEILTEFWVNGNDVFLRGGIKYDVTSKPPGLYLPSRKFLVDLSRNVVLNHFDPDVVKMDENVLTKFGERLERDLRKGLSAVWKHNFEGRSRILEEGVAVSDAFDYYFATGVGRYFRDVGRRRYEPLIEDLTKSPRPEVRGRNKSRAELRMAVKVTEFLGGIIPMQYAAYGGAVLFMKYGHRIVAGVRAIPNLVSEPEAQKAQEETHVDKGRLMELINQRDNSFALIGIPVPKQMSSTQLRKVLEDFRPLLMNHSRKALVLTYTGEMPAGFQDEIYKAFDHRVFLFQGNSSVYTHFYTSQFSQLGATNEMIAKQLMARANELAGEPVKMTFLKQSSLIMAPDGFFEERLFDIAKQFIDRRMNISPEAYFSAKFFFSLSLASLTNAQLLRQQPDEVHVQSISERAIQLFFNSDFAETIQNMAQAARRILAAA